MTHPLRFDQAIREEYRKSENAVLQVENIALGSLRFVTSLMVHTLASTSMLILFVMAVSPQMLAPLWSRALNTAEVVERIPPATLSRQVDDPVSVPPEFIDQVPSDEMGLDLTQAEQAAALVGELQLSQAPRPRLVQRGDRDAKAGSELLSTLLQVSLLIALITGVVANTGRFRSVYKDNARARVARAQHQVELFEMCQAAAAYALAQHRLSMPPKEDA